ncbi:MAG: hypothetical protein ACFFBD_21330, partial [Candidatus Hodarchaeota archaeon]
MLKKVCLIPAILLAIFLLNTSIVILPLKTGWDEKNDSLEFNSQSTSSFQFKAIREITQEINTKKGSYIQQSKPTQKASTSKIDQSEKTTSNCPTSSVKDLTEITTDFSPTSPNLPSNRFGLEETQLIKTESSQDNQPNSAPRIIDLSQSPTTHSPTHIPLIKDSAEAAKGREQENQSNQDIHPQTENSSKIPPPEDYLPFFSTSSPYLAHNPIYIDGNTDFLEQAVEEGWNGTGSPDD